MGRREKGYVVGAIQPAAGDAFMAPYQRRAIANQVDFLEQVDAWLPGERTRVYANLAILAIASTRRAVDVLVFSLAHPR